MLDVCYFLYLALFKYSYFSVILPCKCGDNDVKQPKCCTKCQHEKTFEHYSINNIYTLS